MQNRRKNILKQLHKLPQLQTGYLYPLDHLTRKELPVDDGICTFANLSSLQVCIAVAPSCIQKVGGGMGEAGKSGDIHP